MGIYVNPNNANLQYDIRSQIFIDKSMFIAEINKLVNSNGRFVCVSRARRFGKSMAANMLSAYYSKGCDSRELFKTLNIGKIHGYDEYLNKMNVIKVDVNSFYSSYGTEGDIVRQITARIRTELMASFPSVILQNDDPLEACLGKIYSETGEQFVIIMDEYDVLIREQVAEPIFESYLRFLNELFKNADLAPAIALAYLTGILPIVRDRVQSKLNLFDEFTMLNAQNLSPFVGFTEEEVQNLCRRYGMNYGECHRWYNGYNINGLEIYSPRSVVCAMLNREYDCYWTRTGSFESLLDFTHMDFAGIKEDIKMMLGGGKVEVNTNSYLNTMSGFHTKDDVFTYLIHIGYLAYDRKSKSCYIQNGEIAVEWVNAIGRSEDYTNDFKMVKTSNTLLESVLSGDAGAVAAAMAMSHEEVCSNENYNDEGAFQVVICLAFFYARTKYTIFKELTCGKGFADIVLVPYIPNIPAIIIELKRNKSPETALAQIHERRYFASLEHYQGNLLFVGVNYDDVTKEHTCAIETFKKQ